MTQNVAYLATCPVNVHSERTDVLLLSGGELRVLYVTLVDTVVKSYRVLDGFLPPRPICC